MLSRGLLGWIIFGAVAYGVWSLRIEVDPQEEALRRTVNMVRAEYPGATFIQQSVMAPLNGGSQAAALVVFSDGVRANERRVYSDYRVNCGDPKPACLTRQVTVWDDQDPEFLARASARMMASR